MVAVTKPVEERDFYYPVEVAALLKVSVKTLARWARERRLPFYPTLGGHRRYLKVDIDPVVLRLEEAERMLAES